MPKTSAGATRIKNTNTYNPPLPLFQFYFLLHLEWHKNQCLAVFLPPTGVNKKLIMLLTSNTCSLMAESLHLKLSSAKAHNQDHFARFSSKLF